MLPVVSNKPAANILLVHMARIYALCTRWTALVGFTVNTNSVCDGFFILKGLSIVLIILQHSHGPEYKGVKVS